METIGIRKLKENLSQYIKRVKSGERIVVTDRKREIAVILPLGEVEHEKQLYKLIQNGKASWVGRKPQGLRERIPSRGKSVSAAVLEDRR